MMPKKKRIAIIITTVGILIAIILGVLAFLYIKTDMFKSNEILFAKYFSQNFNIVDVLENIKNPEIENILNNSKYTSDFEANIEYAENIGTTNENKNSPINDVGIRVKSNVDKSNQYSYRNIAIGTNETDLCKVEYINQNEEHGIRLNKIIEFVSINVNQDNKTLEKLEIENLDEMLSSININSILNFSKEEKQSLINTYLNVIQSNISKEKYYKQPKSLITIDNKDMQANSYYIKLTIEEYNNLKIKILEQITKDEIILSKIDLLENEVKQKYNELDKSFREIFIENVNNIIEKIKNNNIGKEEARITVYENNQKTVRTSIEKGKEKITIDLNDDGGTKIYYTELSDVIVEQSIIIERQNNSIAIKYESFEDNNIVINVQLNIQEIVNGNSINENVQLNISNRNYNSNLNVINNIQVVQEFENKLTLDTNNIRLKDLNDEQLEKILGIIGEVAQEQISNLLAVVKIDDYIEMFKNLGMTNRTSIQLPTEDEVIESQRNRFNSQFEYFVSENLNQDNVKELIKAIESNFEDMKVLLKNGEVKDWDTEKLEFNDISEILFLIKKNSYNGEKKQAFLKFVEDNSSNKYTVSLQHDDNGFVNLVRVKIQED